MEIKFEASVASTKTPKGEGVDTLGDTCLRFSILKFKSTLFCVGINFKIRTPNQLQVTKIFLCSKIVSNFVEKFFCCIAKLAADMGFLYLSIKLNNFYKLHVVVTHL